MVANAITTVTVALWCNPGPQYVSLAEMSRDASEGRAIRTSGERAASPRLGTSRTSTSTIALPMVMLVHSDTNAPPAAAEDGQDVWTP